MNLIRLTSWQDGTNIYVDPKAIASMRRLPGTPEEMCRTAVHTATDMFLVRETPDEIYNLAITLPNNL